jgi:hypothetical protein
MRRHVTVNYPAPAGSVFAADAFEGQRDNWPPMKMDGRPIGDIIDIKVIDGGRFARVTALLYDEEGEPCD